MALSTFWTAEAWWLILIIFAFFKLVPPVTAVTMTKSPDSPLMDRQPVSSVHTTHPTANFWNNSWLIIIATVPGLLFLNHRWCKVWWDLWYTVNSLWRGCSSILHFKHVWAGGGGGGGKRRGGGGGGGCWSFDLTDTLTGGSSYRGFELPGVDCILRWNLACIFLNSNAKVKKDNLV